MAAKRRFRNQKLGRDAELLFEAWANSGPFVASKQSEDYGIDYVCREMTPVGSAGTTEETTGLSVAVQVRSTSSSERPRISLGREDAETALRQEGPYCVVGIDTKARSVHFRFLDIETAASWAEFLGTSKSSLGLRLDSMRSGIDAFTAELRRVSRPAYQAKLSQAKALHAIQAAIPGTTLELNAGAAGDWAMVRTRSLGMVFAPKTAGERKALAQTMFSLQPFDQSFTAALRKFSVQPSLHRVWDLTDGPVYFAGEAEREVELSVESGGSKEVSTFVMRSFGDERAYIGRSGLVIRVSDPRPRPGGHMAHVIGFEFRRESAPGLEACGQLAFLRSLGAGTVLHVGEASAIAVEAFGLEGVGPAIAAIERAYSKLKLSLGDVVLADLGDRVFTTNIGFLDAMFMVPVGHFPLPGFVLGIPDGEGIDDSKWRACEYRVPFALKLKSRNLLLWMSGRGEGYVSDGVLCGLRLGSPSAVEPEEASFEIAGDGLAAAYFTTTWPSMPVDIDASTTGFWRQEDLPIEGEFLFPGEPT